jgi:tRNA/rRNA methyltransferase
MKNMGCYDLRIAGNREDYSDEQVRWLSVHATDIWETAKFFEPTVDGLKRAMADCAIAAGTTRRMGQKRKSWGLTPEQFAAHIRESGGGTAAIVFGNERTGLTDEELDCCSLAINIPSNDDFPSLNLSHAVQVMTYTLFRAFDEHQRGYEPISLERLRTLVSSISGDIDRVGLFRLAGKTDNDTFLEGIFARAGLSESEAQRVEKLFRRIAWVKTESAQD